MEGVANGLYLLLGFLHSIPLVPEIIPSHSIEGGQQIQMTTIIFSVFYHVI